MGRTSIIALSGPSSSGKTTLARLLQRIFAHLDANNAQTQFPISTFIIHEDDFYHPDDKIPYTTTKSGTYIQDWDCLGALDINFLSSALRYVREHGHLPPRLKSKEDLNDAPPDSGVDDSLIDELKRVVIDRLSGFHFPFRTDGWTLAILEGFLLFAPPPSDDTVTVSTGAREGGGHPLRLVHDQIDVRLFLPAPYDLVKERREKRSGYVTIGPAPTPDTRQQPSGSQMDKGKDAKEEDEVDLLAEDDRPPQNFWTDPPGYVDDIVWPRYVRDHAWLLLPEDEGSQSEALATIQDDDELIRKVGQGVTLRIDAGVIVAPGQGSFPMAELLKWAVEEVMKHLEQTSRKAQSPSTAADSLLGSM
ncbi:ribosylnicotinamide kinase [Aspergillus lucknowensis]|uniref:Nicotinamide riboside kinase n=1 Tax=Aspergillus lucknowensis TaxID=176173 RepID=A0ABR4LE96_9EURO